MTLPSEIIVLISRFFAQDDLASYIALGLVCKRFKHHLLDPLGKRSKREEHLLKPFLSICINAYDDEGTLLLIEMDTILMTGQNWVYYGDREVWEEMMNSEGLYGTAYDKDAFYCMVDRCHQMNDISELRMWLQKNNDSFFLTSVTPYNQGKINGTFREMEEVPGVKRRVYLKHEQEYKEDKQGSWKYWSHSGDVPYLRELGTHFEGKRCVIEQYTFCFWRNPPFSCLQCRRYFDENGDMTKEEIYGEHTKQHQMNIFALQITEWKNGRKHGLHCEWNRDNNILINRANYSEGELEGRCERWYDDGTPKHDNVQERDGREDFYHF